MILTAMLKLYQLSLYTFPTRFRSDFADEMVEVFQMQLEQQAREGVWAMLLVSFQEFYQLPLALCRVHLAAWRKKLAGQSLWQFVSRSPFHSIEPANDGRFSWWQTFLESMPFAVTSACLITLVYIRPEWLPAGWQRQWPGLGWFVGLFALPMFLLGLARGMPRWAFPAGGLLLGYSQLLAQWYHLTFFWAGMLLAVFALAMMAVHTHLHSQPLPPFLQRIGKSIALDWTRLAFGFYAMLPFLIMTAFDGIYSVQRTPYLAMALVLMTLAALVYSRSRQQPQQYGVLLVGIPLALLPALLHQAAFQGGMLAWLASPARWLADFTWVSVLWAFMITLLLLPMFARLIYQTWTDKYSSPNEGEQPWA
jgi:hypothetical protein